MRDLLFYAVCSALLGMAILTVAVRNLFRAALALLGVLLCTAMLFIMLQAEMVALVQVMVYIGGILIFVLYAVLLTSELGGRMPTPSRRHAWTALSITGATLAILAGVATTAGPVQDGTPGRIASIKALGPRLLNPGPDGFLVPFELVSVVLLAAMVGAIAIARQDSGVARKDDPEAGL